MGSGKSAQLVVNADKKIRSYGDKHVCIFSPQICKDRIIEGVCNTSEIVSRLGISIKTRLVDKQFCFKSVLVSNPDVSHIFVDEINFFSPMQIDELKSLCVGRDIKIQVFGLKNDLYSYLFESSKRCIEVADKITELDPPKCLQCKNPAFVDYLEPNDEGHNIFINGKFISLCWQCWNDRKLQHVNKDVKRLISET